MHGAFLLFGVAVSSMAAARADDFAPMGYNHPGLRVELKGGFAAIRSAKSEFPAFAGNVL